MERIIISNNLVRETEAVYRRLRQLVPLGVLRSEKEYRKAVALLDEILDQIGEEEKHPLADLAEALGVFIESYEDTHAKLPDAPVPEILRSLMKSMA